MKDIIGKKFGRLTVLELERQEQRIVNGKKYGQIYYYLCKCDCGKLLTVKRSLLLNHITTSCGCYKHEIVKNINLKHGKRYTRLYRIWCNMKYRCYSKNAINYERYGGRGIKVCQEWQDDFKNFYDWAIDNGYNDTLSIDRIDNNEDYKPSNCRWLTNKEQAQNRRSNFNITLDNKTQCLTKWAEEYNIDGSAVRDRIARGWSFEKAIKTKSRKRA
jgi:hypothetical protein